MDIIHGEPKMEEIFFYELTIYNRNNKDFLLLPESSLEILSGERRCPSLALMSSI